METERYVLFSPVGMTDPISDCRDGSMLHIARRFRPERVYIYLSQETAAFEEADGRYAGALSLLAEKLGFHVEVTKISRPDLVDVHLFDEFYDEFEGIIKSIKDENPEAVILLNVSSGTPAMKSALHTIAAMTDDAECIPIQVSTPRKAHNERRYDVKKYDLATAVGSQVVIEYNLNTKGELTKIEVLFSNSTNTGTGLCEQSILTTAPYGEWTQEMVNTLGTQDQTVRITFHYR